MGHQEEDKVLYRDCLHRRRLVVVVDTETVDLNLFVEVVLVQQRSPSEEEGAGVAGLEARELD